MVSYSLCVLGSINLWTDAFSVVLLFGTCLSLATQLSTDGRQFIGCSRGETVVLCNAYSVASFLSQSPTSFVASRSFCSYFSRHLRAIIFTSLPPRCASIFIECGCARISFLWLPIMDPGILEEPEKALQGRGRSRTKKEERN